MSKNFEKWKLERLGLILHTYNEIFVSADEMVVHAARASVAVVLAKLVH